MLPQLRAVAALRVPWLGSLVAVLAASALATDYAVIVNKDNKADDLTKAKLVRIFKAEVREWSAGEDIALTLPKAGSAAKKALLGRVYEWQEAELKRHWATMIYQNRISEQPRALPSAAAALQVVAKTRGAITIVPVSEIGTDSGVKVLAIDGKRPGDKNYLLSVDEPEGGEVEHDTGGLASGQPREAVLDVGEEVEDARVQDLEQRLAALEGRLAGDSDAPRLDVHGFTHVDFGVEHGSADGDAGNDSNSFSVGELGFILTSQLSQRVSFLNEIVLEPEEDGEYVVDVERVLLKYRASDAFDVQVGRFYPTLGWWNETYHHGEWMQTNIGRPSILRFEDDEGLMPVNLVGVAFKGRHDFESCALDYALEIANGRGPAVNPPQILEDANDSKAVNLALKLSPNALPGLEFGGSYYVDSAPENSDAGAGPLHASFDETIANVFVHWRRGDWELATEFFAIDHSNGNDARSSGWYAQLARRCGDWTPYAQVDGVAVDDRDTYFENVDNLLTLALGVRWDLSSWSAIKFQASTTDVHAGPGGTDERRDAFVLQTAFTF